jgi:RimJ/RimL family protein N-acetyltransferase
VTIRQIEPGDSDLIRAFYDELTERSRRLRFLVPTNELSDEDLRYLTEVDHKRHEAMVALDGDRLVGVARYVRAPRDRESAEVAVVVVDDRQGHGIGTTLLDRLTERARENGIVRYTALVSEDNDIVIDALERAGAERTSTAEQGEIEFAIDVPAEGLGERLRTALRWIASALSRLRR